MNLYEFTFIDTGATRSPMRIDTFAVERSPIHDRGHTQPLQGFDLFALRVRGDRGTGATQPLTRDHPFAVGDAPIR